MAASEDGNVVAKVAPIMWAPNAADHVYAHTLGAATLGGLPQLTRGDAYHSRHIWAWRFWHIFGTLRRDIQRRTATWGDVKLLVCSEVRPLADWEGRCIWRELGDA